MTLEDTIKEIAIKIDPDMAVKLTKIFFELVVFIDKEDEINVTKLMDTYDIQGYELFYFMNSINRTDGFGFLEHDKKVIITMDKAKELCELHHGYFDWYNGKAFKTRFRKQHGDDQILQRRRIDARNFYGCTYRTVLLALHHRLKHTD